MIRYFLIYVSLLLNLNQLWAETPPIGSIEISASIDPYAAVANKPIPGSISIMHEASDEIDEQSFQMEGQSLKVWHVKDVKISPQQSLQISIYNFELPAKPAGNYLLPPINVKIGKQTYRSLTSPYEVTGPQFIPAEAANKKVTLQLETEINASPIIYPGQHLWFVYRFIFNGDIELTAESLPLFEAEGFKIVGDKQMKTYQQNGNSVQEISQQVQAVKAGEFHFPASYVKGYAYSEDKLKGKLYIKPELVSQTEPITITVTPFPTQGRPASFNGAVGEYTIQTQVLNSEGGLDEKIQLAIDIGGVGEPSTILLPDISNLKALFRIGASPVEEKVTSQNKRFLLELYPLSKSITSIPSISFSYFNPTINQYVTVKSPPIPIRVQSEQSQVEQPQVEPAYASSDIKPLPDQAMSEFFENATVKPTPIEIETGRPLTAKDLKNLPFGTWWSLWLFPIAAFLFFMQVKRKQLIESRKEQKIESSADLFAQAISRSDASDFYRLLLKAFILKLFEKGEVASSEIGLEALNKEGNSGKVKDLMGKIEQARFGKAEFSLSAMKQQAKELFKVLSVLIALSLCLSCMRSEDVLKEANQSLEAGLRAATIIEREKEFNQALKLYSQLETEYQPIYGNGELYLRIGDLYYYLEQYPQAILYDYRALALMPRNENVRDHLQAAQARLGIQEEVETSVFQPILFFHTQFSFPERMQILAFMILMLFLMLSAYIWGLPKKWVKGKSIKVLAILVAICAVVMFFSLVYTAYFQSVEGVMVRPSLLYRAAGTQYATVTHEPILPGIKVVVLEVLEEGKWLKVITANGELGYISSTSARLI